MPLIVRKPFDDALEEVQKKAQAKPEKVNNPEHEEKPVVQQPAEQSEGYHGGSEQTFSLPTHQDSSMEAEEQVSNQSSASCSLPQPTSQPSQQPQSSSQEEQPAPAQENGEAEAIGESGKQEQPSAEKHEQGQAQSSQSLQQSSQKQAIGESQSSQQQGQSPQLSSIFPNPFDQPFIRKMIEQMQQAQDKVQKGEDAEGKVNESNNRDSGNKGDRRESEGEEESKGDVEESVEVEEGVESEDADTGEEDEEEVDSGEGEELAGEESEEQEHTHQYNTQQVVDVLAEHGSNKYYQTEFYRFIEMIAEEKLKVFDYVASEEYNVKKLMFRPYERKPLSHYRMSRIKDNIILILDNSGSMQWWAESLQVLADLALARRDVEVYIAPNGSIEEKILPGWRTVKVSHNTIVKALKGRKIIYVGDFDGANTPVELSFNNDVIWVCPESRYRRFRAHDWVDYDEEDFRGAFLRVYSLDEMFQAFKRLLSYQHFNRVWIDLHVDDTFEDDLW